MSNPSPHSVNSIKTETQRTVSKSHQECILEDTLVRTDERREEELIILYRELQRAPAISGIEEWLRNWESIYSQCKKLQIPDVQKSRAVKDFIQAAKPLSADFSNYWINQLDEMPDNEKPDLYDIVDGFRKQQRDARSLLPSESKISFATFKGNGSDDQGSKIKKTASKQQLRNNWRNPKENDDNKVTLATFLQETQEELMRLSTYSTPASSRVPHSHKKDYLLDSTIQACIVM